MDHHIPSRQHLEEIWEQVPPDYYQKGINKNLLQKFWHLHKLQEVVSAIRSENVNPDKILDVGCASGWFLSEVAKKFPKTECMGVDVYGNAIAYGKKRYKKIKLVHADAHSIPFKKNTFDIVICCEVLEHVIDANIVLQEIKRVVKPGGKAIIEIDSGNWLFRMAWFWWTTMRHGVWRDAHLHPFNVPILEDLFVQNGFSIKKKRLFNMTMAVVFTLECK